jgi:hypothetical protein
MPALEQVARDLIQQFGSQAAAHYVREQAEVAAESGAMFTAEMWRDIADTIDRLLSITFSTSRPISLSTPS